MFARRVTETSRREKLLVGRRCCPSQYHGQTDSAQWVSLHNHISRVQGRPPVTLSPLPSPSDKIVGNPCAKGRCLLSSRKDKDDKASKLNFSRRGFLTSVGVTSGALSTGLLESPAEAEESKTAGPGEVPITLNINGKSLKVNVEPRFTL